MTITTFDTQRLLETLQTQEPGVWQVIQEMHDGVLLCTKNPQSDLLQIVMMNRAMNQLLPRHHKAQDDSSPLLQEVIASQELGALIQGVFDTSQAQSAELHLPMGPTTHALSARTQDNQARPLGQYFQVKALPLQNQLVMVMFNDTTEIRRTEKMRRDFVANVSHELRTPLSAIKGYAETLLEGALEDEDEALAKDFVKVIHKHSQRLTQLVEDLLDLSKLESPDFKPDLEPMVLRPMVARVVSMILDKAEAKQLQVRLEIPEELPLVLVDTGGLEQVLTNLMDNAIKYTPVNGMVTVTASYHPGNMVRVAVQDTGIGIEPKYINRVFERFYRVDKARSRDMGGTGLGLSIVKHIIQLHGGEIWVDSMPNVGSKFSFTLHTQPVQPSF